MSIARNVYRTTVEYLKLSVTADVTLDTQPVEVSVDDRTTWLAAEWIGTAGTTRSCRVLLDGTNMPSGGERLAYVRITDAPEIPVFAATGTVRFI